MALILKLSPRKAVIRQMERESGSDFVKALLEMSKPIKKSKSRKSNRK